MILTWPTPGAILLLCAQYYLSATQTTQALRAAAARDTLDELGLLRADDDDGDDGVLEEWFEDRPPHDIDHARAGGGGDQAHAVKDAGASPAPSRARTLPEPQPVDAQDEAAIARRRVCVANSLQDTMGFKERGPHFYYRGCNFKTVRLCWYSVW